MQAELSVPAECFTPLYQTWIQTFDDPQKKLQEITDKISLEKRMTTAEEIANAVAFLLSERSSHTTGQLIQGMVDMFTWAGHFFNEFFFQNGIR